MRSPWAKLAAVCLLAGGLLGTAQAQTATAGAAVSFGSVNVATAATPLAVTFNITAGGALGTPLVLTQGAQNKDFTLSNGGTCTGTVSVGTCTVNVAFTPAYPGQRFGAVVLLDGSGNTLATGLISGTGVGPQVVYPSNTTISSLGSGTGYVVGVTVDGSGNVYIASSISPANVEEIVAVNGVVSSSSTILTLATGHTFNGPHTLAVDGAGDVFVADSTAGIYEIVAVNGAVSAGSTVVAVGSGFADTDGVALDANGDLFVTDASNKAIYEIVAGTGGNAPGVVSSSSTVNTILNTGLPFPDGVAVDANGDLFVSDSSNKAIYEIVAGTGGNAAGVVSSNSTVTTILSTGLNNPQGVAVDSAGDVFIGDTNDNAVKEIVAGTGGNAVGVVSSSSTVNAIGSGYSNPSSVVVGGNGNVYVADNSNHVVKLIDLSDPPSLSFATPTAAGTTDTTDGPKVVTVQNDGNATLNIAIPATGTNPSTGQDFTLNSSSGSACPIVYTSSGAPGTVASGGECALTLSFTPLSATNGNVNESVVMTDNALNATGATQTLALTGSSAIGSIAVLSSHSDPFAQGHAGYTYSITPYNLGSTATSGTITITDTLPAGFTATQVLGGNYTCNTLPATTVTCTLISAINANSAASPLTITVTVSTTAVSGYNSATISGGGSPSPYTGTDYTNVTPTQTTFVVDSAADSTTLGSCTTGHTPGTCTLRTAITAANVAYNTSNITFETDGAAGTTNFSVPHTITLAAGMQALNAADIVVTITGPGQSLLSLSDGGTGTFQQFNVSSAGGNVTLSGMTFGNSKSSALITNSGGSTVTLTNVTVTGDSSTGSAPVSNTGGKLTLNNCTITGNTVTATATTKGVSSLGSGVSQTGNDTLTLNNCTITGNTITMTGTGAGGLTAEGGGVANTSNYGTLNITNSTISGNTLSITTSSTGVPTGEGGGVYNSGTAVITGSTIGSTGSPNSITATNSSTGASVSALGGGIYNSNRLTITNSSVGPNTVTASSTSSGKVVKAAGGGIYSTNANVTMSGTTVSGNTATCTDTGGCTATGAGGFGGGIYGAAALTLNGSSAANTISGNSVASGNSTTTNIDGGGIYAALNLTLIGATVSGNSAPASGGGIYAAVPALTNVTITGNSSTNGVGGLALPGTGATTLNNVTLYDNTGGTTNGFSATNAATGANNILIDCASGKCPSDATEITSTTGLNLGTLQNNGGGVQTLLPGAGSTAIGAGSNCTTGTDERAYTRPTSGTCDVGAVRVASQSDATTVNAASAAVGASSVSLTASVTYSGGTAPSGAYTFTVNGTSVTATCSGTSSPLSCTATFNSSALAANTYTITGTQNADSTYDTATNTATLTVSAQITPTVTVSPATILQGTSSTALSATVAYTGSTAPTGAFTFQVDSGATVMGVCSGSSSPLSCTASYNTAATTAGAHTITGAIASDTNFTVASGTNTLDVASGEIWIVDQSGSLSELNDVGTPASGSAIIAGGSGTAIWGGVAFDSAGDIWSVNSMANQLLQATSTGSNPTTFTGGGLNAPAALAVDGLGQIWIANGNGSVSLFTNTGTPLTPTPGYTGGSMSSPSSISIDVAGNVWVANSGNGSVTEILGGAAPSPPLAVGTQNKTLGVRP